MLIRDIAQNDVVNPILLIAPLAQERRKLRAVMHPVKEGLRHHFSLSSPPISKAERSDFVPILGARAIRKLALHFGRSFSHSKQGIDGGMRQRLEIRWDESGQTMCKNQIAGDDVQDKIGDRRTAPKSQATSIACGCLWNHSFHRRCWSVVYASSSEKRIPSSMVTPRS
jgi:hypothetical protein